MPDTIDRNHTVEAPDGENLVCEVMPWNGSDRGDICEAWRVVLRRLPEKPAFLFPEWTEIACRIGAARPWRVLVVKRGASPLAVIPVSRRTPWTAEITSGLTQDALPVLIDPSAEEAVWQAIAAWMRGRPGVGLLTLGRTTSEERIRHIAKQSAPHGISARVAQVMPDIRIPLPDSWEAYLAGLSMKRRADLRYQLRCVEQQIDGLVFEVVTDPAAAESVMAEMIALHRRRWRNQAHGSIFDDSRKAQYYREVIRWAVEQQMAGIAVIRFEGRLVAAVSLLFDPDSPTVYAHYLASDRTTEFPRRFSPGMALFALAIRWVIARGGRSLDMSAGTPEYKRSLGGHEHPQWELSLARSPLHAAVLSKLNALHFYACRLPRYASFIVRRRK